MKEAFRELRLTGKTKQYLNQIIKIIEQYQAEGYRLTLRQLYYQLVAGGITPNQKKEYNKLSRILTDARMGGLVDWSVIEDRVRLPKFPSEWDSIQDAVNSLCAQYRLPRWADQIFYVELWTEKDAIAGILEPLTKKYHIHLVVNRGYSSASAMYDASKRFLQAIGQDHKVVVLYLGDHDPSGLDMDRDIKDRIEEFGAEIEYKRIGLTWEQIQQYHPPPNPAKFQDPRAAEYIKKYGRSSWEVDALPPNVLHQLVEKSIQNYVDRAKYNAWIDKETKEIKQLKKKTDEIDISEEE